MAILRKEIKRAPYVAEMLAYYREYEWGEYEEVVEDLLDRLDHWQMSLEDAEAWDFPLLDSERGWVTAAQDICMGLLMTLGGLTTIADAINGRA